MAANNVTPLRSSSRTPHRRSPVPRRKPTDWKAVVASYAAMNARLRITPEQARRTWIPKHPAPGVLPDESLAMDAADSAAMVQATWAGGYYNYAFSEGLEFLGYPYLSELAQRPEYRRIVEIVATEMTRKWIRVKSKGDKDQTKKIDAINDELVRLNAQSVLSRIAEYDGYMGRAHLYLDTGQTDKRDELMTDIGDGLADISARKVSKARPLQALRPVEAVWTYPTQYNSSDPLAGDWYRPEMWYVMGKQVHVSRLLPFIGREVPDLLKPAYSFGGLSMTQMAKPYVDNWLQTRQSVNDIISAFSQMVLKTDMSEQMQVGGELLFQRIDLFNNLRNNRGTMVISKEDEEFANVSAPLGGLDHLQAQAQEHMAAVSGIPIVKLLGIQPSGLNASSEGEIRTFYDWIAAQQEHLFRVNLTRVIRFVQLSLFDEVDEDIVFDFQPLWALDESAQATVDKTRAETANLRIDSGVIAVEEERRALAARADSPYPGLDPEDAPDLLEEEEEGLEPEGGRPQPQAAEGEKAKGQDPEGADDAMAQDDFNENDHPRAAMSPDAARLFGKMDQVDLQASIGRVTSIPDDKIREAVGDDPELADRLIARKQHLASLFGPAQDEFNEADHPHAPAGSSKGGQFVSSGGGSGSGGEKISAFISGGLKEIADHLGLKGLPQSGKVKHFKSDTGLSVDFNIASGFWSISHQGDSIAIGTGSSDLVTELTNISDADEQESTGPETKPTDKEMNDTWNVAKSLGFETNPAQTTTNVCQASKADGSVLTLKYDGPDKGKWTLASPGHVAKMGNNSAGLKALLSANSTPSQWASFGVKNYVTGAGHPEPGQTKQPSKPGQQPDHYAAQAAAQAAKQSAAQNTLTTIAKARPKPNGMQAEAIDSYKGSGYHHINSMLRKNGTHTAQTAAIHAWLEESALPEDVTLFRSVAGDYSDVLKSIADVGMVFRDRGFISTTTNADFVFHHGLRMEILCKAGQKGAAIKPEGHTDGEYEVLLQSDSRLKIVDFDWAKGHIKCELVQPETMEKPPVKAAPPAPAPKPQGTGLGAAPSEQANKAAAAASGAYKKSPAKHYIQGVVHNPKKPGTKAHEAFSKLKENMTVQQYIEAMGSKGAAFHELDYGVGKGHLKIVS